MYSPKDNTALNIDARLTRNGFDIIVEGKKFSVEYPLEIWQKTPLFIRQFLLENLVFGETNFLPLIIGKTKINYLSNYPLFEPYFFESQLYDLFDCERIDGAKPLSYFKKFYNLDFEYKSLKSSFLNPNNIPEFNSQKPKAVIPFTFGKESLATFAICLELGIEPILVYCQEPSQPYEEKYKIKKRKEFQKKFHVNFYFIKHEPGLFRYGKAFNMLGETELGWGGQTMLLTLLVAPFVYAHKARYVLFGNEYLNNYSFLLNGWRVYTSIDQSYKMIAMQNNLLRLLTNNQCEIKSSFECLDEINIFYLLHHRYPNIGKYQFSCTGEIPLYNNTQWCHRCQKCKRSFIFALACGIDPQTLGFKKDLTDEKLFDFYFSAKKYDSDPDLDFAFYILYRRGYQSKLIEKFKKLKLPQIKSWSWYYNYFTKLRPIENLPPKYREVMVNIFQEEFVSFKKILSQQ